MDIEGTPCHSGLQWWQETWERTSRLNFWRESWCSYLLWEIVPSSNLSSAARALLHSEEGGCTHIYKNCLVCLWKSEMLFYFSSKPRAQAFLPLGSKIPQGVIWYQRMAHWINNYSHVCTMQTYSFTLWDHRSKCTSNITLLVYAQPSTL